MLSILYDNASQMQLYIIYVASSEEATLLHSEFRLSIDLSHRSSRMYMLWRSKLSKALHSQTEVCIIFLISSHYFWVVCYVMHGSWFSSFGFFPEVILTTWVFLQGYDMAVLRFEWTHCWCKALLDVLLTDLVKGLWSNVSKLVAKVGFCSWWACLLRPRINLWVRFGVWVWD